MDIKLVDFGVVKQKIIKTDEILQMYLDTNSKLKKTVQVCRELKSNFELTQLEKDRCVYTLNSLKGKYECLETQYKDLSQQKTLLEEKYNEQSLSSQMCIQELQLDLQMERELKKARQPRSPIKKNKNPNDGKKADENGLVDAKKIEELSQKLQECKEMEELYKKENSKLCNQNSELQQQISADKEQHKNIIESLQKERDKAYKDLHHMQQEINANNSNHEKVCREKDKEIEKLKSSQIVVNSLKTRNKNLEHENKQLKQDILTKEASLAESITKLNYLKTNSIATQTDNQLILINEQNDISVKTNVGSPEIDVCLNDIFREMIEIPNVLSPFRSCSPLVCDDSSTKQTCSLPEIIITPCTPLEDISTSFPGMVNTSDSENKIISDGNLTHPNVTEDVDFRKTKQDIRKSMNLRYLKRFKLLKRQKLLKKKWFIKKKSKLKYQDSVLKALQVLKRSKINFTISNESTFPIQPADYNLLKDCCRQVDMFIPPSRDDCSNIECLNCKSKNCKRMFMLLNNSGDNERLLGFFNVKKEKISPAPSRMECNSETERQSPLMWLRNHFASEVTSENVLDKLAELVCEKIQKKKSNIMDIPECHSETEAELQRLFETPDTIVYNNDISVGESHIPNINSTNLNEDCSQEPIICSDKTSEFSSNNSNKNANTSIEITSSSDTPVENEIRFENCLNNEQTNTIVRIISSHVIRPSSNSITKLNPEDNIGKNVDAAEPHVQSSRIMLRDSTSMNEDTNNETEITEKETKYLRTNNELRVTPSSVFNSNEELSDVVSESCEEFYPAIEEPKKFNNDSSGKDRSFEVNSGANSLNKALNLTNNFKTLNVQETLNLNTEKDNHSQIEKISVYSKVISNENNSSENFEENSAIDSKGISKLIDISKSSNSKVIHMNVTSKEYSSEGNNSKMSSTADFEAATIKPCDSIYLLDNIHLNKNDTMEENDSRVRNYSDNAHVDMLKKGIHSLCTEKNHIPKNDDVPKESSIQIDVTNTKENIENNSTHLSPTIKKNNLHNYINIFEELLPECTDYYNTYDAVTNQLTLLELPSINKRNEVEVNDQSSNYEDYVSEKKVNGNNDLAFHSQSSVFDPKNDTIQTDSEMSSPTRILKCFKQPPMCISPLSSSPSRGEVEGFKRLRKETIFRKYERKRSAKEIKSHIQNKFKSLNIAEALLLGNRSAPSDVNVDLLDNSKKDINAASYVSIDIDNTVLNSPKENLNDINISPTSYCINNFLNDEQVLSKEVNSFITTFDSNKSFSEIIKSPNQKMKAAKNLMKIFEIQSKESTSLSNKITNILECSPEIKYPSINEETKKNISDTSNSPVSPSCTISSPLVCSVPSTPKNVVSLVSNSPVSPVSNLPVSPTPSCPGSPEPEICMGSKNESNRPKIIPLERIENVPFSRESCNSRLIEEQSVDENKKILAGIPETDNKFSSDSENKKKQNIKDVTLTKDLNNHTIVEEQSKNNFELIKHKVTVVPTKTAATSTQVPSVNKRSLKLSCTTNTSTEQPNTNSTEQRNQNLSSTSPVTSSSEYHVSTLLNNSSPLPDYPASAIPESPTSPLSECPSSPLPECPASPLPECPASPLFECLAFPLPECPVSPGPKIIPLERIDDVHLSVQRRSLDDNKLLIGISRTDKHFFSDLESKNKQNVEDIILTNDLSNYQMVEKQPKNNFEIIKNDTAAVTTNVNCNAESVAKSTNKRAPRERIMTRRMSLKLSCTTNASTEEPCSNLTEKHDYSTSILSERPISTLPECTASSLPECPASSLPECPASPLPEYPASPLPECSELSDINNTCKLIPFERMENLKVISKKSENISIKKLIEKRKRCKITVNPNSESEDFKTEFLNIKPKEVLLKRLDRSQTITNANSSESETNETEISKNMKITTNTFSDKKWRQALRKKIKAPKRKPNISSSSESENKELDITKNTKVASRIMTRLNSKLSEINERQNETDPNNLSTSTCPSRNTRSKSRQNSKATCSLTNCCQSTALYSTAKKKAMNNRLKQSRKLSSDSDSYMNIDSTKSSKVALEEANNLQTKSFVSNKQSKREPKKIRKKEIDHLVTDQYSREKELKNEDFMKCNINAISCGRSDTLLDVIDKIYTKDKEIHEKEEVNTEGNIYVNDKQMFHTIIDSCISTSETTNLKPAIQSANKIRGKVDTINETIKVADEEFVKCCHVSTKINEKEDDECMGECRDRLDCIKKILNGDQILNKKYKNFLEKSQYNICQPESRDETMELISTEHNKRSKEVIKQPHKPVKRMTKLQSKVKRQMKEKQKMLYQPVLCPRVDCIRIKEETNEPMKALSTPRNTFRSSHNLVKKINVVQNILITPNSTSPIDLLRSNCESDRFSKIKKSPISQNKRQLPAVNVDNNNCDILSKIMNDMDKDRPQETVKPAVIKKDIPTGLEEKQWRKRILDIAEVIYNKNVNMSDIYGPQPYQRKRKGILKNGNDLPLKVEFLLKQLLKIPNEDEIPETIMVEFKRMTIDFIIDVVIYQCSKDIYDKPDNKYYPAPLMTRTQRILLNLLVRLEKDKEFETVIEDFLFRTQQHIYKTGCGIKAAIPLTRLYLSICRLHANINRMRTFCCEAFFYAGDLAIPILFTVLTSWIEVLPLASEVKNYPMANVIVQLVHLKTCGTAGYNLHPLKCLLSQYHGYPKERRNCDEVFHEICQEYLTDPSTATDYAIRLYCKHKDTKWVYKKLNEFFKPLIYKIPQQNVNFKASTIILMGKICRQFKPKIEFDDKCLIELKRWFEGVLEDNSDDLVQQSVIYSVEHFPTKGKKKGPFFDAKVTQEVVNATET